MKELNQEVLHDCAHRLLFEMKEEEYQTLEEEFHVMIAQMQLLKEIPGIEDVTPMTFPFDVAVEEMREDVPEQPLDRDVALSNVKNSILGQVIVPKVVG